VRAPVDRFRLTDYDHSLIPNRFVAFLDQGVVDSNDWVARSGRSLGQPGWGFVYHTTLMMLDPDRPNVLVETGTNVGTTAIIIAQAILDCGRDAVLHTIEIDEQIHAEAKRRFDLAGVARLVRSHLGSSLTVLPDLLDGVDDIPLAFLDGNHFHDHVVHEFELVVDHMRSDGLVIFDNTAMIGEGTEDPRVNGALRTIVDRHGGNLVNLPFCSWYTPGIAIWQRQAFADMTPPAPDSFVSES
jgi:predicted O-methyltransferase YrrM